MAEFPTMPFFTDAYLGDTLHLSLEEHGAYLKLLIIAWRTPNCELPNDDARIATMLGITKGKWAKMRPIIMAFWNPTETGFEQKKLKKVRAAVMEKSGKAKRAADTRWNDKSLKSHEVGTADASPEHTAEHMPEPCLGDANQNQNQRKKDIRQTDGLPAIPESDILGALAKYNDLARSIGLAEVKKFTPERKRKLKARLKDHGTEGWGEALEKLRESPFLRGDSGDWRADFDFLMRPSKLLKVIEGGYSQGAPAGPGGSGYDDYPDPEART